MCLWDWNSFFQRNSSANLINSLCLLVMVLKSLESLVLHQPVFELFLLLVLLFLRGLSGERFAIPRERKKQGQMVTKKKHECVCCISTSSICFLRKNNLVSNLLVLVGYFLLLLLPQIVLVVVDEGSLRYGLFLRFREREKYIY